MGKSQKSRKGTQRREAGVIHLPPIRTDLTRRCTMRFTASQNASTTVSQNFTYQNLLDTQLVATSATAVYDLFDAVKIHRVSAYAFTNGVNGPCTVTISGPSGNAGLDGDTRTKSDTGIGQEPAVVHFVPDRRSTMGQWQASSSTVAFRISTTSPPTAGTQVVVDVDCTFRNVESLSPNGATAGVGLVMGQWYYRGLDGLPAASSAWLPLGIERIA